MTSSENIWTREVGGKKRLKIITKRGGIYCLPCPLPKSIKMINPRKMRIRHLRELDKEKGWEEATWGT
jgi:hypothetical protein